MKIFGLFGKAAEMMSGGSTAQGALVNKRHPNDVALQPYGPVNYGPMNYPNPKKSKTDLLIGALGVGAAALPLAGGVTQLLAQRDAGKAVNVSAADLPNRIVYHADNVSETVKAAHLSQNLILHVIEFLYTPVSEKHRERRTISNNTSTVS